MTSRLQDNHPAAPENTRSTQPAPWWPSRAERRAHAADADARTARAHVDAERSRAQAAVERLEHEQEQLRLQTELAEQRAELADKQRTARHHRLRAASRRISLTVVLAGANGGVNAAAVLGQVLALSLGLGWPWWAALPVALVVESVAVNVGYFAHDKLIKGYSAIWLRLLSYGIGAGVGIFNYSHNASIPATADFALVFGGASLMSPVLWQIYSQWRHWELLRERGLLEPSAPSFGLRWLVWTGETLFIWRRAVRYGVSDRAEADTRFRPQYESGKARAAVIEDDQDPADEATDPRRDEVPAEAPEEDLDVVTEAVIPNDQADDQAEERERPDEQDNRAAEQWIKRRMREGRLPTQRETADKFGFSVGWARLRVQAARDQMTARGYRVLPGNSVQPPEVLQPEPPAASNGKAEMEVAS